MIRASGKAELGGVPTGEALLDCSGCKPSDPVTENRRTGASVAGAWGGGGPGLAYPNPIPSYLWVLTNP